MRLYKNRHNNALTGPIGTPIRLVGELVRCAHRTHIPMTFPNTSAGRSKIAMTSMPSAIPSIVSATGPKKREFIDFHQRSDPHKPN
ncbi:unnamed protein product, partial [Trichogramma brassicae]